MKTQYWASTPFINAYDVYVFLRQMQDIYKFTHPAIQLQLDELETKHFFSHRYEKETREIAK